MSLLSTEKCNELFDRLSYSQEGCSVYRAAKADSMKRTPASDGYYHQIAWEARRNWVNDQITKFHVFDKPITIDGKQVVRSDIPD